MLEPKRERREYQRFDTEVKIHYQVKYDIKTKVDFQRMDQEKKEKILPKYEAVSRNVSAEGICFLSHQKLQKGDTLYLEVYLPSSDTPIPMQGEVCWSHSLSVKGKEEIFTGVKLFKVREQAVAETIYFDENYRVIWSIVLESIFGSFRKVMQNKNFPSPRGKG